MVGGCGTATYHHIVTRSTAYPMRGGLPCEHRFEQSWPPRDLQRRITAVRWTCREADLAVESGGWTRTADPFVL